MSLNIFKNALAERKAATETIATPSGYHALLNAIMGEVKIVNGWPGSGRKKVGDWVVHPSTGQRGVVNHAYDGKDVPETKAGRLIQVDYNNHNELGHTTGGTNHREFEVAKSSNQNDKWIDRKFENSTYTNPDGSFKIVNGSQEGACVALLMERGHSEESATRMANAILNAETDNTCLPGTLNGLATASCKADVASEAAERTNTAGSHFAAKNAHEHAGNLAARLGDTEKASHHAKKASEHQKKGEDVYPKGQTDKKHAGSPKA